MTEEIASQLYEFHTHDDKDVKRRAFGAFEYSPKSETERSGFRIVLRRRPVRPCNEAVSERPVGERHTLDGCADVPGAQSTRDTTA